MESIPNALQFNILNGMAVSQNFALQIAGH
jgi:hypothetical protein